MMVAPSQATFPEESPFPLRPRKLSSFSRPFPAGFIPVLQTPPSNRPEIKRGFEGPIFLPADLLSPLPPSHPTSHEEVEHLQENLQPQHSSSLHLPASNHSKLIPSIKRICGSVRLGQRQHSQSVSYPQVCSQRQLNQSVSSPDPSPLLSHADQHIKYHRPTVGLDSAQGGLRNAYLSSSPRSSPNLGKNTNQCSPRNSPPKDPGILHKKPSISAKVIKKAKSIGDLRIQRKRLDSVSSGFPAAPHDNYYFARLPVDQGRRAMDLGTTGPQLSSTTPRAPQRFDFPHPVGEQGCKREPPVILNQRTRTQSTADFSTHHCAHSVDLPYYIRLESIDNLEREHGKIMPSRENWAISF